MKKQKKIVTLISNISGKTYSEPEHTALWFKNHLRRPIKYSMHTTFNFFLILFFLIIHEREVLFIYKNCWIIVKLVDTIQRLDEMQNFKS